MPGVDEHHRSGPHTANPFEESKPHISEYTAKEIATLQARLEKQLGPEYLSSRAGPGGGKLTYITADKVINLANEVFGFNGWSSEIKNITVDFVDETAAGKVHIGLSVIVRVTLRNGSFHEDIGYGQIDNCKSKATGFEKAKKEGTTDALKRALRNFGNILGNCVYDKDYVAKVTKIKVGATKYDIENLHRAPQFAPVPVKKEVEAPLVESSKTTGNSDDTSHTEVDDDFGAENFDEADFSESYNEATDGPLPDPPKDVNMGGMGNQVHGRVHAGPARNLQEGNLQQVNPASSRAQTVQPARIGQANAAQVPNRSNLPTAGPQTPNKPQPRAPFLQQQQAPQPQLQAVQNRTQPIPQSALPGQSSNPPQRPPPQQHNQALNHVNPSMSNNNRLNANSSPPGIPSGHFNAPASLGQPQPPNQPPISADTAIDPNIPPAQFFSARAVVAAATALDPSNPNPPPALASLPRFNPNADSPSIRKTTGIDHARSGPVPRTVLGPSGAAPGMAGGNRPTALANVQPIDPTMRRVGAPPSFSMASGGAGQTAGPGGMSTSSFRSPVVKRNAEGAPIQGTMGPGQQPHHPMNHPANQNSNMTARRPPLNDVTNAGTGSVSPLPGSDVKRVKTEHGGAAAGLPHQQQPSAQ